MTCSYSKEFSAQSYTDVENVFIYEYLPESNGNAVKVYLYGLFLCQNKDFDIPIEKIAENLKMTVEEVKDCFSYWEEFGLLNIVSLDPFTVQYLPVKTAYTNKPRKYKAEKYTEFTKSIQALLPSRMISTSEYTEYFYVMETYGIKPDAMLMIVKYCVDQKGDDVGYKYISTVAKNFGKDGIITVEKIEQKLSSYVLRSHEIEEILKALSVKRRPEVEDLNYLKKWTEELNFEYENIVFTAKMLKKGNMEKLDSVLLVLYSKKSFSKEEIENHFNSQKEVMDLAVKINKSLSVYVEVLDTFIDVYLNKWLSYGFSGETLIYVASHCFTEGKNSHKEMDELLEFLRNKGFIDLSSVSDYFTSINKSNEFISKLLLLAGVNRRPTPWDRENLETWKSWNFTEEMILEAAKLASGKNSPIPYMNGILSNWKNNEIFSVKDINLTKTDNNQSDYNKEYENRRYLAISKAQKNLENAMEIEGFNEVYVRLNSIEKDLAFAEINENKEAFSKFENEKNELIKKEEKLLSIINLKIEDLSPKYRCEKCQDTGYIGSDKCDCFNKK